MNLALIPARGGSKRIPRKNLTPFAGKPMIAWSIEAAQASMLFSHIIVSTDSEEIASVARGYGVEVPFMRPAELADDHAGTIEVVSHAVRQAESIGIFSDNICCIYATAPFVRPSDLRTGLSKLDEEGWDYVFAGAKFSCPVQQAGFVCAQDGGMRLLFPEHRLTRSQDLPPVFFDAGQFYWGRRISWLEERPILGNRSSFVELPPWRVQDIDTPDDWKMAEFRFAMLRDEH